MDASILREKYRVAPADSFSLQPDPAEMQPSQYPMDHPTAYQVGAGQTGADFLPNAPVAIQHPAYQTAQKASAMAPPQPAPAAEQPGAPAPAKVLAHGATSSKAVQPEMSDDDRRHKALIKRIYETGKHYKQQTDLIRKRKKEVADYNKLKTQLEHHATQLQDHEDLENEFKVLYPDDSRATMSLQARQAKHLTALKRLREDAKKKAADISKRYGIPLGKDGDLDDDAVDAFEEEANKARDMGIGESHIAELYAQ